jgi:D-apiose dehydrogenase
MNSPAAEAPTPFAIVGAGFWSQFHAAAWQELRLARCVAIVDRDVARAESLAQRIPTAAVFGDFETMLTVVKPHFVDIVTTVESHAELAKMAAQHEAHVICQKPLGESLSQARGMVQACDDAGVQLSVHENWRWQKPLRQVKHLLEQQPIGKLFRATVNYNNSFPVFDNQPNLKELEQFILFDMGTHLFDAVRFLFGEAKRIYCQTNRSRMDIRGEDVASTLLLMANDVTVACNLSYASRLEHDRFPETRLLIEGDGGSIALDDDYWVSLTTAGGTKRQRCVPDYYAWADSRYEVVHSSMVDCQRHLLESIRTKTEAETSGRDNLRTLAIIEAAYQSAQGGQAIELK